MSFKDFVTFLLRMSGFGLVINTFIGLSSASFFMLGGASIGTYGDQIPLVVASILVPVVIGLMLAFMPYKITDFIIFNNEEVSATPEFCGLLTRVGVALLGIYIIVSGLQFFIYNVVLYTTYSPEYLEQHEYMANLKGTLISQALRVIAGFCLVFGSKVISIKLTKFWFKAKTFE